MCSPEDNTPPLSDCGNNLASRPVVPVGAPDWVTPQLIQDTLDTWNSHYAEALKPEDALEILINVNNLFQVIEPERDDT